MAKLVDGTLNPSHSGANWQVSQQLVTKFVEPSFKCLQEDEDLECLGTCAKAMSAVSETICRLLYRSQSRSFANC
ncbi:hypothetical protein CCR75_000518 [Bremia lactucae]|uniref:Uncharacterized protein n=1 Tax=Bremia lactucae TaxID=4779 RepID=A0A976IJ82_BRELC|nr:hypothetical protein CCR75_000518 [Bremia lactucae]